MVYSKFVFVQPQIIKEYKGKKYVQVQKLTDITGVVVSLNFFELTVHLLGFSPECTLM